MRRTLLCERLPVDHEYREGSIATSAGARLTCMIQERDSLRITARAEAGPSPVQWTGPWDRAHKERYPPIATVGGREHDSGR